MTSTENESSHQSLRGVGLTSLWVAAMRAIETERSDAEGRLCEDPFARRLAGPEGFATLAAGDSANGAGPPVIPVRTRYFDDRIAEALRGGVEQIVILAAGMDARAFRLPLTERVRVFEIDRAEVFAHKEARLEGAQPRAARVVIAADLAGDWHAALTGHGMDPTKPTFWLVEGLLVYLDAAAVDTLFARIDALSAPGSFVAFDALSPAVLEHPVMAGRRKFVAALGAPWTFGMDDPEAFASRLGWTAQVIDHAELGASLGRWPFPVAPRGTPGFPRSFLVTMTK